MVYTDNRSSVSERVGSAAVVPDIGFPYGLHLYLSTWFIGYSGELRGVAESCRHR